MASAQSVMNEAAAARALIRSLVEQAGLQEGGCTYAHAGAYSDDCAKCAARNALVELREMLDA